MFYLDCALVAMGQLRPLTTLASTLQQKELVFFTWHRGNDPSSK
jgi:hypothetical protein